MANYKPEYASRGVKNVIVDILMQASKLKTLNYRVNNITISQNRLLRVANAIDRNKIPISLTMPAGTEYDLAYDAYNNILIFPKKYINFLSKDHIKAAIVHEAIHISNDIDKLQNLARVDDEASAYIGQVLYHYNLNRNMKQIENTVRAGGVSRGFKLAFGGAIKAAQCVLNGTHRQLSSDSDYKVAIKTIHYRLRSSSEYRKSSNLVYNNHGINRKGIKFVI